MHHVYFWLKNPQSRRFTKTYRRVVNINPGQVYKVFSYRSSSCFKSGCHRWFLFDIMAYYFMTAKDEEKYQKILFILTLSKIISIYGQRLSCMTLLINNLPEVIKLQFAIMSKLMLEIHLFVYGFKQE